MLKKRSYIVLSLFLLCGSIGNAAAQLSISIPESNFTGSTDYSVNLAAGSSPGLGIGAVISVSVTSSIIPATSGGSTTGLPASAIFVKAASLGGINLLSGSTETALTTSPTPIYATLLALGAGTFTAGFRAAIASAAWQAGTYSTSITFSNITPNSQTLTITVPAVLAVKSSPTTPAVIQINDLAAFRSAAGVSTTNSFSYTTTVPGNVTIKSAQNAFSFSSTQAYTAAPTVSAAKLSAALTSGYTGSAVNLSTTAQSLSSSSGVPVPVGNQQSLTSTLSVTSADLKSSFAQAGTYTLPLVYTTAQGSGSTVTAPSALTLPTTNLQLTVAKISELVIPASTVVNMNFNSASTYQKGLSAALSNPVTLSSTVPYQVTVRAGGNFSSGTTTIPAGVVIVEAAPSETSTVTPVVLSTSPQLLVNGTTAVIDRTLNLQFRIPATQTANLLGKPAGTYANTVIFSLVAP